MCQHFCLNGNKQLQTTYRPFHIEPQPTITKVAFKILNTNEIKSTLLYHFLNLHLCDELRHKKDEGTKEIKGPVSHLFLLYLQNQEFRIKNLKLAFHNIAYSSSYSSFNNLDRRSCSTTLFILQIFSNFFDKT